MRFEKLDGTRRFLAVYYGVVGGGGCCDSASASFCGTADRRGAEQRLEESKETKLGTIRRMPSCAIEHANWHLGSLFAGKPSIRLASAGRG